MSTVISKEAPWRSGLKSARANLVPGLVLQTAALLLVTAYYQHDATRQLLGRLAHWREETGVLFAIVSTGFFGGLLPALYLKAWKASRRDYTWMQVGVLTAFWAYKGFEVDLFYRTLAHLFGEGHDLATIATKTLVDEFIYCPFLAVPVSVIVYEWVQSHFATAELAADLRAPGWIKRRMLPLLISTWSVWVPAVSIIYALPTSLQLPLQNLVLCFFTLLIAHQTKRRAV